jgi:hypothetical protein
MTSTSTVLLRPAGSTDSRALNRLALLDSAQPLKGDVLLAEVDGEPVAALSTRSGAVVADPFKRTAALVRALVAVANGGGAPAPC